MKKIALKTYGRMIGLLLSLFGFLTSCETKTIAEYGVPSADYIVKGKVTDAKTDKPIQNIRVVVPDKKFAQFGQDTVYTNSNGEYEINFKYYSDLSEPYNVIAADIDGFDHDGLYKADTLKVTFEKNDLIKKGDGGWYSGIYQKINQNFKLNADETIAMYGVMGAKYKEDEEK